MESLFSWITPSAAQTVEEKTTHLPPPDFLSIVRRSRRGRLRETTPTGAQSLTPLELRLKDLVLNIYSDESSRKAPGILSESELSEVDSGNCSDRPTTSFSDFQFHSPSPVGVMTEHRSTTPIRSYETTPTVRQGQSSQLPSFFSADDVAQVSQDPQLPVLSETRQSQFQFGQRGTEPVASGSSGGHSHPSSYAVRPPYATLTTSAPLSLPLYSHTELTIPATNTQKNSSTANLRSLVSRSFQIPPLPPSQQVLKQAPPPPHHTPQQAPPPPHHTPQQTLPPPHHTPQQAPPRPHQAPPSPTVPSKDGMTGPSTSTTPPKLLAIPPASLIGLPHMQQSTTSGADTTSEERNDGSELSTITTSSPDSDELKQLEQADIALRNLGDSDSVRSVSSGQDDSCNEQRGLPKDALNDNSRPHRGGKDGEILTKTPSRGHLKPDSPLSPKDIRDRLADVTRQGKLQKDIWSTLTFPEKTAVRPPLSPLASEEVEDDVDHTDFKEDDEFVGRRAESRSSQPSSLPASFAPSSDREKTPTHQSDDVTDTHTLPLSSSPFTAKMMPLPSKYAKTTSTPSPMKMPDHLKPAHKPSPRPSFPLDFIPDPLQDSRIMSLPTLTTLQTPPTRQAESSLVARTDVAGSSSCELAVALHSKAHLEGQLESVMTECRDLLKERAELNSKLAVLEAEMDAMKREARTASVGSDTKSVDPDTVKLREELKISQSELKRERRALEALREEAGRGRASVQRLQAEVGETRKKAESCELQVEQLRKKLREATSKQDEERASREESQHQLHSLQGSYRALEDSKSWMQGQLQEALEAKIGLQEELRSIKASSIASTVKMDQLSRENATLMQQISTLQNTVFHDKARLVTELEEIEADILSKESSYTQLVAENARLQELAEQRATEIESLSTAVGQAQVERDELLTKERERAEKEQSLTEECLALRKSLSEVERRLQESEAEMVRREEDLEQVQKLKLGLQERLRQSEAALISKDGALQSLQDSRDILQQELDMVKRVQQQMEGELEEERRQVARLQASLAATEDGSCDEEGLVRSLTDIQQHLETQIRELREKLSVREMEARRWEREVATLQAKDQDITQKMHTLQRQFHSTTSERDSMREAIRERDGVISRLTQENKTYREEAVNFRSAMDNLQSRLNTTLQQKSRLEGQLAEQSSLGELEHLQVAVRERTELQKQLDSLKFTHQQELLRAQARQGQLEAELKGAKRQAESVQRQVEKAMQAREETAEKMTELKSRTKLELSEMERAVEEARVEKQVAERDITTLKAELEELHEQLQRLQNDSNSVRERLAYESAQKGEVERESGMVALKLRQKVEERERELREQNHSLSLELERLKGRLVGNSTTQQAMRTHANQLESALAQREAALTRASAEIQTLMEEQRAVDSQLHTETASLREEAHSIQVELTETQKLFRLEQDRVNELTEELVKTSHELAKVRAGQMAEGKDLPALEERTSRLERDRDELRLELTTVRAQLVVAKTAAESSERALEEKKAQVEILQQKLTSSEAECRQAERELRAQLLRGESVRESSLVAGEVRRFDTSLSTIGGDEDTDSILPATHDSSASVSSYGDTTAHTHQALHSAQLRELGQQIERARRQGQEAAEAKTVGEISVLRDKLGSKSRTISSLQSCLVSLRGDMGKLQHKMQSHSATVRASHYTTKQLEAQLADLKRSSSLQSPSFLSDHT